MTSADPGRFVPNRTNGTPDRHRHRRISGKDVVAGRRKRQVPARLGESGSVYCMGDIEWQQGGAFIGGAAWP